MTALEFVFSNFWNWLGFMTVLYIIVYLIVDMINRIVRHRTLRKIGYPPEHCNADGEFKKTNNNIKI